MSATGAFPLRGRCGRAANQGGAWAPKNRAAPETGVLVSCSVSLRVN